MIDQLLVALRDGWNICNMGRDHGRWCWQLRKSFGDHDEYQFIPIPDGWVRPQ